MHLDPAAQPSSTLAAVRSATPEFGVNIHLLNDDASLDLARSAGFRFVRMDMLWANVERRGRFRFFAYDRLLRACEDRGMGVLWILDYGHPEHGGNVPRTPEDITAFAHFAEAAAARFKGHDVRYEIWNEPNVAQFWTPSPNPAEYKTLLREAVAAIRHADPAAKISSGGLSKMDLPFLRAALDPGLAANLTALAIHPYPSAGPESILPEIQTLRAWMAQAVGQNVELWDTEWGYSSSSLLGARLDGHADPPRKLQAALAAREFLVACVLGFPLAVWYDLRDDGSEPTNPDHNYGLIELNRDEKPAMQAARTFLAMANEHRYAGLVSPPSSEVLATRWQGREDIVFTLWTVRSRKAKVEFPQADLLSATDLFGNPLKLKKRLSGRTRLELKETAGPVYLRFASPGRVQPH